MKTHSCATHRVVPWAGWCRAALLSIALHAGFALTHAQAPVDRGGQAAVTSLADHLSGFSDLGMTLSRLGNGTELESLPQRTGNQVQNFPARSVLETLVQRADAAKAGEGDRLIAALVRDARRTSAAVANDPAFSAYVNRFPPEALDLRAQPLKLAPITALSTPRPPLPPAAAKAVTKLAEYYTELGVARLRAAALAHFRKPGFDTRAFDNAVLKAADPRDAVLRMIDAGTPPPTTEAAVRRMMMAAAADSAAFAADQAAMDLIDKLAREPMPDQERYAAVEDQFESRKAQYEEAGKAKLKTKVTPSPDAEVLGALSNPPPEGGIGGGGGSPSQAQGQQFAQNYDKYNDRTFQSPKGDATARTPRSFSSARFSARAGRGVSVGAQFHDGVKQKISSALWVPNEKDNRFGRLFVTWKAEAGGKTLVAASRPMFADSFRSAVDVLWRPQTQSARFEEGNILVVMSMDPEGPVSTSRKSRARALWAQHEAAMRSQMSADEKSTFARLRTAMQKNTPEGDAALEKAFQHLAILMAIRSPERLEKFDRQVEELTAERDIVFHPALFGRELAWSAARVDFWTNRPEALGREASLMAADKPAPAVLKELPLEMSTWQYYERDGAVVIEGTGTARQLVVRSIASKTHPAQFPVSTRSHFSLAMFSEENASEATPAEDNLYRRPDAERRMQPLLDWLAVTHHDYMRLNDFSESLMLLRWLKSVKVPVQLMDMAGDRPRIAAPDRVNIDTGPKVGP